MPVKNILNDMLAQEEFGSKKTEKQQRIAKSAITLFAEKGYANTSTSEIARAAGVAEGTIFRHYRTKINLLLSLILPFLKEAVPPMAEDVFEEAMSNDQGSFDSFLRALIKNRLEFFQENKEVSQLFVKEVIYNDELKQELLPLFTNNVFNRLEQVIELYKNKGELIDIPADEMVKILFLLMGGYFLSHFIFSSADTISEEKEVDHIMHILMDGVRRK